MLTQWLYIVGWISFLSFTYAYNSIPKDQILKIEVEATWKETNFYVNLLESISGYDESLYVPTIELLFGLFEDSEDIDLTDTSEETIYSNVLEKLSLSPTQRSFIDFNIVNKVHIPRVISHYEYYNKEILPQFKHRLVTECSRDSFGNIVETDKQGNHQTWLLYNDKLYCSGNDLFALQTDKTTEAQLLPFDRVIGHNREAPLLILYGNPISSSTKQFIMPLYQDAQAGKIRFVWRYIPQYKKALDSLTGYGVELRLKDKDYYINMDKLATQIKYDLKKNFAKINNSNELISVAKDSLKDIGIRFSSFVLSNRDKIPKYELLNTLLGDFPKFIPYISKLSALTNFEDVKSKAIENEKKGLSKESYGFYINGSPIHPLELDVFKIISKLKTELNTIEELIKLGFNSIQSKLLITKFALLSAVKQSQFRSGNTLMGNNENRFRIFEHSFDKSNPTKGGVLFFNDIARDQTYEEYETDPIQAYLGAGSYKLKPNQIPALKENIHDLVFAVNFGSKNQLRVFFTLSKIILDNGIPQQVGILPLIGEDPLDKELADSFFYIASKSDSKEALAFLYKYLESKNQDEVDELVRLVKRDSRDILEYDHESVLELFSISQPSVIFNGVINDLASPNWQISMGKQIAQDIGVIKNRLGQGGIQGSLKELLYSNAKPERNLRIVPLEPSEILYKAIDRELIQNSVTFRTIDRSEGVGGTFWLVSRFNKKEMFDQLVLLLKLLKTQNIQIRVINTGGTFEELETLQKKFKLNLLASSDIDNIINIIDSIKIDNSKEILNPEVTKLLAKKHLPVHHSFMLFNSRYFRIDKKFSLDELNQIIEYEYSQRLNLLKDIVETYPDKFDYKLLQEFNSQTSGLDNLDWFDLVCSIVTKSFHVDDKLFVVDVNRFDFSSVDMSNSFEVDEYNQNNPVDVLLILDPMQEYSQKVVSIVSSIRDLEFVNIRILLQPQINNEEIGIGRFYKGSYPSSQIKFDDKGRWLQRHPVEFDMLPGDESLAVELDVPNKWIVSSKNASPGVTMDNINFSTLENSSIVAKYELKNILIEGYARDIHTGRTPDGLSLELTNSNISTDTSVMSSLNYFQIKANPGIWKLSAKPDQYALLSASENKHDPNAEPKDYEVVSIFSLAGRDIHTRVSTLDEKEVEIKESKKVTRKHADINIFTIAGGKEYEKLLSIMIASVRKHNTKSVRFWILDNYISPGFKQVMPLLAEKYNIEYEFISYKWPNFLRKQKEIHRTIWGYKILFLDVLFPQDLDKIIFIDADQICRTDLTELTDIDLEGAAYGFTPMCDSRKEMDGFRFWKSGYWSEVLKDDLKYHISALYVVDLKRFREIHAGDRLRSHYQKLSSDPNSLSNLDQDLPNNMQRSIKIFSLPQEWLWCETWCGDESLKNAKMVDLCNNPLTKENKLDVARRLLPEWIEYESETHELFEEAGKRQLDQVDPELEEEEENDASNMGQVEDDEDEFYHDEL
ncbi:KRE5 [[Candida] subhashii]|uniref:KRE5 n=1 Tax=[Candida] subhashii TaxID=561895 RepID=A0A8J5QPE1_9ASCO|nr:KRE5 [[Candida] subhashii]KAG7664196.1 KRE5 [[Candida] subhashii]